MNQETPPLNSPRRLIKLGLPQKAAIAAVAVILVLSLILIFKKNNTPSPEPETPIPSTEEPMPTPAEPGEADLQPIVDSWIASLDPSISVGLMIYDLDRDEIAAAYQPDKQMNIASIYKLFYVYAGYRQIANGSRNGSQAFVTSKDYRAATYSFAECLDLMIRESYNGCADPMRANAVQTARAEAIIDELQLKNTHNVGLVSTAADLTKLLRLYWEHPDLPDETWDKIADSMLNQPPTKVGKTTIYDWRQGLPTGFSTSVHVYDKVGWAWNENHWDVYADAAILEFPDLNRHYSIVVLTSGIHNDTPYELRELGRNLESAISGIE